MTASRTATAIFNVYLHAKRLLVVICKVFVGQCAIATHGLDQSNNFSSYTRIFDLQKGPTETQTVSRYAEFGEFIRALL